MVALSVVSAPDTPRDLQVTSVNDTCVTAVWRKGGGHSDSYSVQLLASKQNLVLVNVSTAEPPWTRCGIDPGTVFYVMVSALSKSVHSAAQTTLRPNSTSTLCVCVVVFFGVFVCFCVCFLHAALRFIIYHNNIIHSIHQIIYICIYIK